LAAGNQFSDNQSLLTERIMMGEERALLKRCAKIGTSTWSDALDSCGITGVLTGLTQRAGSGRFAAFAVTARAVAGQLGDFTRSQFGVGEMVAALGPGCALMVDLGGANISTFGGLASLAALKCGAAAVVIDGGCRDVDEIAVRGLWLASRHVTPVTGKTRLKLEAINEPVNVAGITVCHGDLVVGDMTGIVVVPRGKLDEVLTEAERMLGIDEVMEQLIEAGTSFSEAAARANYIR
jgi:regulator of RNase E activity RraA